MSAEYNCEVYMKVNRVNNLNKRLNIKIDPKANTHRKYLYNEMVDLMNKGKFGGEIANDYIKLNGIPARLIKYLKKAKIVFEKLK